MKRLCALFFLAGCGSSAVHNVPRQNIVVTAGAVEAIGGSGEMHVDSGGMRAEILGASSDDVELDFVYRGPSHVTTPLANGEVRRQIGLKLRAQDTCNVVSVMWHLEPAPGIAVAVKRNEGQREHAECGTRGYANIAPESSDAPPFVDRGEHHRLRARIDGDVLRVYADGAPVWEGKLPAEAFAIEGPAGVRSDNGAFDFALRLSGPNRPARVTYTLPDR
jgi:hypothetical protein